LLHGKLVFTLPGQLEGERKMNARIGAGETWSLVGRAAGCFRITGAGVSLR